MKCPECGQERFDHEAFNRWVKARLATIRLMRESYPMPISELARKNMRAIHDEEMKAREAHA